MTIYGGSIISLLLLCRQGRFWKCIFGGWCGGRELLYEYGDISDPWSRAKQSSVYCNVKGETLVGFTLYATADCNPMQTRIWTKEYSKQELHDSSKVEQVTNHLIEQASHNDPNTQIQYAAHICGTRCLPKMYAQTKLSLCWVGRGSSSSCNQVPGTPVSTLNPSHWYQHLAAQPLSVDATPSQT